MKLHLFASLILICADGAAIAAGSPDGPRASGASGWQFRDCDGCPDMVVIPAGAFTMGSPPDEPGRRDDEGPQIKATIDRPFAFSRYEVTRRQYQAFLDATKHPVSANCMTDRRKPGTWALDAQTNFHDPGFAQTADHPAACVSWNDAIAYIAWLNSRTGGGYRLPSEAEWEYVARAGSTTAYPWGASIDDGCPHMNGYDKVILEAKGNLYQGEDVPFANCTDGQLNTSPVGTYRPNAFGVYDMIGNLGEWVENCATASYAASSAKDCTKRVVRGGSWGTQPRQLRSAERTRYNPADVDDSIGIRLAKTQP